MVNRVKVFGAQGFQKKLKRLVVQAPIDTKKEMLKIIVEMDIDVKKTISRGSRSGRIYGKRKHQASARNEAPKTDGGGLVGGFLFDVKVVNKMVVGRIRNISDHAAAVEFKPKSKGGRPFMKPLYKRWRKIASRRLGAASRTTFKKVKGG